MRRDLPVLPAVVFSVIVGGVLFRGVAYGQEPSAGTAPSTESAQHEPAQPSTAPAKESKTPPETESQGAVDPATLLPAAPSLPKGKATLVGGTVEKLDRVQDRLTVRVFGGDKVKILFDGRTKIFVDGAAASSADLHEGDRVYVDTMLDGSDVFARNISIKRSANVGESHGMILKYTPDKGELVMRDALSPQAVKVRITSGTKIIEGDRGVSAAKLSAGTLIAVKFGSEANGRDVAREISILAVPGASFTFQGQVTALDLRTGLLVVTSPVDHKVYEIYLDPAMHVDADIHEGSAVTVTTKFDGSRYVARSLTINSKAGQ